MTSRSVLVVAFLLTPAMAFGQTDLQHCTSIKLLGEPAETSPAFVVTMFGNVLARPTTSVNEGDQVRIRVLATEESASRLSVQRISPARRVGELRIVGLPEQAVGAQFAELLLDAAVKPTCYVDVTLADFRPGLGEAEIRVVTNVRATNEIPGDIRRVVTGAFDFNVEPVFVGMISLGPVVTHLSDPTFIVASNGASTYIAETESGRDRVLYALVYTPFILGKRVAEPVLTRSPRSWLQRVNPMFGLVLNDIRRNALVGLSLDLPFGLAIHGGWHVGRVSEIDPASGLVVGSAFPADGTIPVSRTWSNDRFVGVTLDMRVALRLIGLAGSTSVP